MTKKIESPTKLEPDHSKIESSTEVEPDDARIGSQFFESDE